MNIRFEKGINEENASLVCKWSNEKGEKFQEQWMGDLISFPIDYEKLKEIPNLHSIYVDDEFMGTIQQVRIEEDNIHFGRFMINPANLRCIQSHPRRRLRGLIEIGRASCRERV